MYLWKRTSADNKITIRTAENGHIRWVFDNLKSDDVKELAEEVGNSGLTKDAIINRIISNSKVSLAAFLRDELLFCAGLYKDFGKNPFGKGDIMWWIPSDVCEKKPVAYARASYNMINMLKRYAKDKIYTYTPMWYTKNFRPTKHLGFSFLNEFEMNGKKYMLSALEVA